MPTSNCGLTSSTTCAPGAAMRAMTGITYVNEMNDTSDTIMLGRTIRQIIRFDVADVDAAHFDDALVACDARVKLAVPHVERDHMRGTASQKHVAETAGGRADVEAIESFRGTQADVWENHVERADKLYAPRET